MELMAWLQVGTVYPLRIANRSAVYLVLPAGKADKSGSRDGHFDLWRDGRRSHHTAITRTYDQGDAGELKHCCFGYSSRS
jgi:hypothetical protein